MTPAPSDQRARQIVLTFAEIALRTTGVNGLAVADDTRWFLQALAIRAPAYAAHLDRVMRAVGPEVAAAVRRQASQQFAAEASHRAGSGQVHRAGPGDLLRVGEAAALLNVTAHAVRAACRRKSIPAVKGSDGGWLIRREDVEARRGRG